MIIFTISLKGYRDSNEDSHSIILNNKKIYKELKRFNLFAIYDGHGGSQISKYLSEILYKYLMHKGGPSVKVSEKEHNKYIYTTYDHIEKSLERKFNLKQKAMHCGSTALVLLHYPKINKIKVLNLGDCRAVICNKKNKAIELTIDHKPNIPNERNRITKLGGKIYKDGPDYRIEGLSVSRSFGDLDAKPYISHRPQITNYKLKKDKFIILACDGLWDVFSSQQAIDFVELCKLVFKIFLVFVHVTSPVYIFNKLA